MSRQIQIRRGTVDENDAFTGAIGEITMDTTNKTLRIHDGETPGGTTLAKQKETDNKMNKNLDNISNDGKTALKSVSRQFNDVSTVIAQGNASIATSYDLSQYLDGDTTSLKMGLFSIKLITTQTGFSRADLKSDTMIGTAARVCGTNNGNSCANSVWLPFKKSITLSFPETAGGIHANTALVFVGWM